MGIIGVVFLLMIFLRLNIEREIERERDFILKIIVMEEFLKEFGDYYGYLDGLKNINEICEIEFKRLD